MLSQRQIERLVQAGSYRRLSRRILANGRCQDARIIERLLEPRAVAPAALGLALQRLLELSWGPSVEAQRVAQRLLACQRADGLFGSGARSEEGRRVDDESWSAGADAARGKIASKVGERATFADTRDDGADTGSVAATAIAAAGLWLWLERAGSNDPAAPHDLVEHGQRSLDAAVGALQRMIESGDDLRRGGDVLASIDAVIILWQLAGIEELETRLDLDRLARRLQRDADLADLGALFRHYYSSAA